MVLVADLVVVGLVGVAMLAGCGSSGSAGSLDRIIVSFKHPWCFVAR